MNADLRVRLRHMMLDDVRQLNITVARHRIAVSDLLVYISICISRNIDLAYSYNNEHNYHIAARSGAVRATAVQRADASQVGHRSTS